MRDEEHIYAYIKCGRKAWHLGDLFRDWEECSCDRGDYVEHHTFRRPLKGATADDRQLARDYATPFAHAAE